MLVFGVLDHIISRLHQHEMLRVILHKLCQGVACPLMWIISQGEHKVMPYWDAFLISSKRTYLRESVAAIIVARFGSDRNANR
jgi:hypothetical protein